MNPKNTLLSGTRSRYGVDVSPNPSESFSNGRGSNSYLHRKPTDPSYPMPKPSVTNRSPSASLSNKPRPTSSSTHPSAPSTPASKVRKTAPKSPSRPTSRQASRPTTPSNFVSSNKSASLRDGPSQRQQFSSVLDNGLNKGGSQFDHPYNPYSRFISASNAPMTSTIYSPYGAPTLTRPYETSSIKNPTSDLEDSPKTSFSSYLNNNNNNSLNNVKPPSQIPEPLSKYDNTYSHLPRSSSSNLPSSYLSASSFKDSPFPDNPPGLGSTTYGAPRRQEYGIPRLGSDRRPSGPQISTDPYLAPRDLLTSMKPTIPNYDSLPQRPSGVGLNDLTGDLIRKEAGPSSSPYLPSSRDSNSRILSESDGKPLTTPNHPSSGAYSNYSDPSKLLRGGSSLLLSTNRDKIEGLSTNLSNMSLSSASKKTSVDVNVLASKGSGHKGLIGLRNLGNTCFMNSILQCLIHTCSLKKTILENAFQRTNNGPLSKAFVGSVLASWESNDGLAHAPAILKAELSRIAPQFSGYSQQDAQEFLRVLLDAIHTEMTKGAKPSQCPSSSSVLGKLFSGKLRCSLTCLTCGHESITLQEFWDLSLPLPYKSAREASLRLDQCLAAFTTPEVLDGGEMATCERCRGCRPSQKQMLLDTCPEVLVVHLSRFYYTAYKKAKNNTPVSFPPLLDLAQYTHQPDQAGSRSLYRLYAVSSHSGGMDFGHYWAACYHDEKDAWFTFNDSSVTPSREPSTGTEAYILFYERVSDA